MREMKDEPKDYVYCFEILVNVMEKTIKPSTMHDCVHLTNKGGVVGTAGTHFRWGAGIRITKGGKLVILATSRNVIAGTRLNTNYWVADESKVNEDEE